LALQVWPFGLLFSFLFLFSEIFSRENELNFAFVMMKRIRFEIGWSMCRDRSALAPASLSVSAKPFSQLLRWSSCALISISMISLLSGKILFKFLFNFDFWVRIDESDHRKEWTLDMGLFIQYLICWKVWILIKYENRVLINKRFENRVLIKSMFFCL